MLELAHKTLNYFRNNRSRINYHKYLATESLIGNGAMEGACKQLVKEEDNTQTVVPQGHS